MKLPYTETVETFTGITKGFACDTAHYEIRYEPGKTIVPLCKECAAVHKMAKAIIWKSAFIGTPSAAQPRLHRVELASRRPAPPVPRMGMQWGAGLPHAAG